MSTVAIAALSPAKSQADGRYSSNDVAAIYVAAMMGGAAVGSAYNNTSSPPLKSQPAQTTQPVQTVSR